ncbi:MAG: hypothetical protein P8X74_01550 [Reinekea sp.]
MTEQQYDLFFNGQLLDGFTSETVKQGLQQRLKLNDAYLANLFSGHDVQLKQQVDKATAIRFQQAFKAAGARLIVKVHVSNQNQANETRPATGAGAGAGAGAAVAEQTSPGMNQEPSDTFQSVNEDSDSLIEQHQPKITAPTNVPNWGVAAPGTILAAPQQETANPEFTFEELSVAAPGTLMTSPGFEEPAPIINTDNLSLATNNGDIEILHDEQETVKVDTSHLSLQN